MPSLRKIKKRKMSMGLVRARVDAWFSSDIEYVITCRSKGPYRDLGTKYAGTDGALARTLLKD